MCVSFGIHTEVRKFVRTHEEGEILKKGRWSIVIQRGGGREQWNRKCWVEQGMGMQDRGWNMMKDN